MLASEGYALTVVADQATALLIQSTSNSQKEKNCKPIVQASNSRERDFCAFQSGIWRKQQLLTACRYCNGSWHRTHPSAGPKAACAAAAKLLATVPVDAAVAALWGTTEVPDAIPAASHARQSKPAASCWPAPSACTRLDISKTSSDGMSNASGGVHVSIMLSTGHEQYRRFVAAYTVPG